MSITGGLILYMVIWFLALFVIVPIGQQSQADAGKVVPGTPASAPARNRLKRQMLFATIAAAVIWSVLAWIILSGMFTRDDLEALYHWMRD